MSAAREIRRGTTLIELLVVLALLAVAAAVTAIAFGRPAPQRTDERAAMLAEARQEAVGSRRAVTVIVTEHGDAAAATAYPDGRVIAQTSDPAVDMRSGRPVRAR